MLTFCKFNFYISHDLSVCSFLRGCVALLGVSLYLLHTQWSIDDFVDCIYINILYKYIIIVIYNNRHILIEYTEHQLAN